MRATQMFTRPRPKQGWILMLAACVAMSMSMTASPAARADTALDALAMASSDADLVLIVPSLQRVNKKIAMVNTEMGLNFPGADDVIGQWKLVYGLGEGVSDEQPMLVAVTGLVQAMNNNTEPNMLALVPLTDYEAFTKALGGDPARDVTDVQLPDGNPGFARKSGNYAVVSNLRENVEKYEAAGKSGPLMTSLGKLGGQFLPMGDVAIVVNMARLSKGLKPKIEEARRQMDKEFANLDASKLNGMDPASIKGMLNTYLDAAEKILGDAASATIGLDLSEKGAGLSATMQFRQGSEMAKVCATPENGSPLLNALPNDAYLFASSFNFSGTGVMKFFVNLLSALPDDGPNGMWKMVKQNIALMNSMQGFGQVVLAPKGAPIGAGGLFAAVSVIQTADGKAYVKEYSEALKSLNGLKVPLGPMPNGQTMSMSFTSSYTANAMAIDGVQVDQYALQYNFPPELMQQMGPMAGIMTMLGVNGQQGYLAATGDKVVMTTSLDAQLVKQALGAIKGGEGLGSRPEFEQVRKQMPTKPTGEMYLSIEGVVSTANVFLPIVGQPPLAAPQGLPPVAFWVSIDDGGVAKRLFIPMPTAQYVKDTIETIVPQVMGGQPQQDQQQQEQPQRRNPSGPPPAPF